MTWCSDTVIFRCQPDITQLIKTYILDQEVSGLNPHLHMLLNSKLKLKRKIIY